MRSLCVFCGSSPGRSPSYAAAVAQLGATLAARGTRVVYGGARVGTMGMLAEATLAAGGEVVGVIPQHLMDYEVGHDGLTELHVVGSMHERKALMADLADGFVALPGGMGTLEELAEILTWAQLGLHRKPVGALDVDGYWQPLLTFLDHARDEEFLRPSHRELLIARPTVDELLAALDTHAPADGDATDKWVDR
ncbi:MULTISPECIES: TIGR00730 family Rossman fold protein [Arsenicicoccus]|uniref:Cytokinin riboside 5'-monophosphate phosphoribohydrolase n=1 Tax=Arsenicicoccus bolidensis TaxID=229480 RepID=A0ABS9PYJ6_9MICO|nr:MULTISPECIES: TIGR00730 family Rossman fold protein [Arsenicicoccus]MCG7320708.1 TIGR00730 family Rossman fold protein [Arsenicicoccus bolidensis]